jgi:cytochrome c oxidase subunit IV
MAQHTEHSHATTGEISKPNTKAIWRTFWILLVATMVEFAVAFLLISPEARGLRIAIFVGLTIVKAFYIVGEFMHLGHEAKGLIWSVLIPCIFVVWFIVSMLYEGGSIFSNRLF